MTDPTGGKDRVNAHADDRNGAETLVKADENSSPPCYEWRAPSTSKLLFDLSAGDNDEDFIRCRGCFYDTRAELSSVFQRHLFQEKEAFASRNDNSTPRKVPRNTTCSTPPDRREPRGATKQRRPSTPQEKKQPNSTGVPGLRPPGAEPDTEPPPTTTTFKT
ncbi:unnamed protein product [Sphacelaria rigidula]